MADNIVDIALISPVKFVKEGLVAPGKYNTRFKEDYIFEDTIPKYYARKRYAQPWQTNDAVPLQILSNYSPHQLELYRVDPWTGVEMLVVALVATYKPSSIEGSGVKAYEFNFSWAPYEQGMYRFRLRSGDPFIDNRISEWICLKEIHPQSVLIEYWHDENDFDTVFETGIRYCFRVQGGFTPERYKPGGERVQFADQTGYKQLNNTPFDLEGFLIGDTFGVPGWVIQRFNHINRCRFVTYDGKQYVINTGAQFESSTAADYPLVGYAIDLREADAATKKRFIADGAQGAPLSLVYNFENRGFGAISEEASSNLLQIINLP